MRLYFVRHGETNWNKQDLLQGHTDIPLNAAGIAQAAALSQQIAQRGLKFDAIYASPLQRVLETARIIADGKEIIIDQRLMERCGGDFEGRNCQELFNHEIDFLDPELNSGAFGVEPILGVQCRAKDFLADLCSSHPADSSILIVSSNGLMKRFYQILHNDFETTPPNFRNGEIYECKVIL